MENILDTLGAKVAISETMHVPLSAQSFNAILAKTAEKHFLDLELKKENLYQLKFRGNTFADFSEIQVLIGKDPDLITYNKLKSNMEVAFKENGEVVLTSFEYFIGVEKERKTYKKILQKRLELFTSILKESTNS